MKVMRSLKNSGLGLALLCLNSSCGNPDPAVQESTDLTTGLAGKTTVVVEAENLVDASVDYQLLEENPSGVAVETNGWLAYNVTFDIAGRYRSEVYVSSSSPGATIRIEDYCDNQDGRFYDVTGGIPIEVNNQYRPFHVMGSPFNKTARRMKLHLSQGGLKVDKIVFTLIKPHQVTPITLTQNMEGDAWHLVWADEFEGTQLDLSHWIYDIGNWGWGNNELQFYTENRPENARVEGGNLIIEARKDDLNHAWTSARLTTRGRVSFLYGKIELRAKVPRNKGNWAAGWTLGDRYVDEISWPYCGEIDILESVGFEVDDVTGNGTAHVTVHTPAYYFKKNNQISSLRSVANMAGEFHTYGVEWTPTEVRGYVDGEHCYTYDKIASPLEWPFDQPQNIILNLAMGGGWGGAQGMDESVTSQKFIIDYVRIFERR